MANWAEPDNDTGYGDLLLYLSQRLTDLAQMFCDSSPVNQPDKSIKWNQAGSKLQQWSTTGAAWSDLLLAIAGGGTGAATASGARTNLGLGTMATQNSGAVSISAGAIAAAVLSGLVPTANLGTGTANAASFLRGDQSWAAIPSGVPTGSMVNWGTAAAPTGYLLCDGSAVSRTTYAALFSVIGVTFGVGDGSTTFNLPNAAGKFILCKAATGTGSTLAASGGAIDHTHTGPSHVHAISVAAHLHTYDKPIRHTHTITVTDDGHYHEYYRLFTPGTAQLAAGTDWGAGTESTSTKTTGISATTNEGDSCETIANTSSAGAISQNSDAEGTGASGTNNPPYLVLNMIIKT